MTPCDPLRVEFPGAWFHVTACGNEQASHFWQCSDMDEGLRLQLVGDRRESSICACGFLQWSTKPAKPGPEELLNAKNCRIFSRLPNALRTRPVRFGCIHTSCGKDRWPLDVAVTINA